MLKTRCPSCGKSASFDESDAGLPVVCLACGARYAAPDLFGVGASAGFEGGVTAEPLPSGRKHVGRIVWIAAALGTLAAAAVLGLVLRGRPDPIDRATAVALASAARAYEAEGRLADAHRKYHELETIVGGRAVRDRESRGVVEQAGRDDRRVYAALLQQADQMRQAGADSPSAASQPSTAPVLAGASARDSRPPSTATGEAPLAAAASVPAADPRAPPPSTAPAGPSAPTTRAAGAGVVRRPPIHPMPETREGLSDEAIGEAIEKGVNHLLGRFDPATHALADTDTAAADGGGLNALAVYALIQCGQAVADERLDVRGKEMDAKIAAMKASRLRRGHAQTYATGIRATALALFNRPQDRSVLKQDVAALYQAHTQGSYTYAIDPAQRPRQRTKSQWDNSNSQYGLLGVWAGAEAGVEVPSSYWSAVGAHWVETQLSDGTWSYAGDPGGSVSMTAAGLASLFVTHDWLDAPKYATRVGREPFSPALQRGLNWLEQGGNALDLSGHHWSYTLYGIERVGLASGFKYFGANDWYRRLAETVVAAQQSDGSWGDTIDTSFALLFLARGRHPVLMNKVRFGGYWANRPRDAANLTRFAARALERELNWQVVPLRPPGGWTDWLDSPILYIASHKTPALVEADYDNLRQFVDAGGLLFTHADGDSAAFNQFAADLAAKLFEKYEMADLSGSHDIYNLVFKIDAAERPALRGVSNGSRLLMVHSPVDISRAWQLRQTKERKDVFHLGINLFLYAAGKRDLRNRLDSTFVSDPGVPTNGSITVARLEYAGNWDPEPAAWPRFGRWFQRQTGTGLNVTRVKLAALKTGDAPLAHLTGTAQHDFTADDAAVVKAYVEAGGVLFVDQVGGTGPFDRSALDTLLVKAFPGSSPAPLDPTIHPIFRTTGPTTGMDDLTHPKLRPFGNRDRVNEAAPISAFAAGKGHVVFTPIDVTSGLLGSRTWGVAGLHPDYAAPFVKNLVFWTLDGQADR